MTTLIEEVPVDDLIEEVPVDDLIILENHTGDGHVTVSKHCYTVAESRDVIQLLPLDDEHEIRTFYKWFWKVVQN